MALNFARRWLALQWRLRRAVCTNLKTWKIWVQLPRKKRGNAMLQTFSGFSRIGEENAFAVLARAAELAAQGRDIVSLGIGQPDFPTPPHIVEAAIKALKDGHHGYTPATGILPLREAVAADLHKRFSVEVSPADVAIVPGGKVTMFATILMFGEPGAEILYPDPGFPIYRSMIEFTGAKPIPIPIREENGFAFSAEETLSLITPKTRLVIINSPANPTGGVTPKSEVDKFVAGMEKHPNVAIMSDEIYDQMVYDGEKHVCLLSYPSIRDRLILLNGWSKTYAMTGWRMGYSIWPKTLYENIRKLAVNGWSCVSAPSQYAAIAALTGPQDAVHHMVAEFDKRRKVVVAELNKLPGISCATPKGAFYAFPNIKNTGWKAKKLASSLLEEAGVAIIGGPDFGILGEGYVRLSYANSTENILKAIGRMGEFLSSRKAA
jgi:aspartate aminotransferase